MQFYSKLANFIRLLCMGLMGLLVLVVLFNVIARYAFSWGLVGLQELEWHIFGLMFLLGMNLALYDDSHVRVDIFYKNASQKKKHIINIFGLLFFVLPLSFLICSLSFEYVLESFSSLEASPDPGGLPYRWVIKAAIIFSFFLLIIFSVLNIFGHIKALKEGR